MTPGWYISPTNPEIQHYWDGNGWSPRAIPVAPGSSAKPWTAELPPIPKAQTVKSGGSPWRGLLVTLLVCAIPFGGFIGYRYWQTHKDDHPNACSASCQATLNNPGPEPATTPTADPGTPNLNTATDALTGFGATRAVWDQHHHPDPDTGLVAGCCYGPRLDIADQSNADTWFAVVAFGGPYIDDYSRNFPAGTDESTALALLAQDDFPSDATATASQLGDGCKLFSYDSSMLAANVPDIGSGFSFGLYSPGDGTYDPGNVEYAILTPTPDIASGC